MGNLTQHRPMYAGENKHGKEDDHTRLFADIEAEQRERAARVVSKDLLRKVRTALKAGSGIHKIQVSVSSRDPEMAQFALYREQGPVHSFLQDALPELDVSIRYEFCWYGAPLWFCAWSRWPARHRLIATVRLQGVASI